jgi:hypothetical protein
MHGPASPLFGTRDLLPGTPSSEPHPYMKVNFRVANSRGKQLPGLQWPS